MPRLMDKKDWLQTVAEVDEAANVWYESVVCTADSMSLSVPETGRYRIIMVKLEDVSQMPRRSGIQRKRDISPRVRALRGAAKLDDDRDYKDILADSRMKRFEALG